MFPTRSRRRRGRDGFGEPSPKHVQVQSATARGYVACKREREFFSRPPQPCPFESSFQTLVLSVPFGFLKRHLPESEGLWAYGIPHWRWPTGQTNPFTTRVSPSVRVKSLVRAQLDSSIHTTKPTSVQPAEVHQEDASTPSSSLGI